MTIPPIDRDALAKYLREQARISRLLGPHSETPIGYYFYRDQNSHMGQEYGMSLFSLPDPQDLAHIIADHLDALCGDSLSTATRVQVINNCIGPMALAIQASEMVSTAGELEQIVFAIFIGTLARQVDTYRSQEVERGGV
jgi:hypothetical protein